MIKYENVIGTLHYNARSNHLRAIEAVIILLVMPSVSLILCGDIFIHSPMIICQHLPLGKYLIVFKGHVPIMDS